MRSLKNGLTLIGMGIGVVVGFFFQEGIRPGVRVVLESVAPYRGTVTARLGERSVVMGTQVARKIWVVPAK